MMDTVENEQKLNDISVDANSSDKGCEDVIPEKEDSSVETEVAVSADSSHGDNESFKKPLALESKGKATKLPKSVKEPADAKKDENVGKKSSDSNSSVPYIEPAWSSTVKEPYSLEIIKSGTIIDTIDISRKPFLVFGRQSNSDIQLAHPTISRHHAVLQHCGDANLVDSKNKSCQDLGIYIYDLGSTHGTFINKRLIPKQRYIRLHVGHILKFGGSTRSYVLLGPETDTEKESDKSVTELKQEADSRRNARISAQASPEEVENDEEDKGIDWGFGEDADEETDLSENPFAATQNEDLYLEDPKKTLRGWFEREGEELEYNVEEKSFGQFLCQVKLPLDDSHGRTIVAEALVKGKKKESVVQCALEACRILDRMGLLRQANHESKKRKARNWEEDDFYESDEDTFLDRTGTVERKREKRMRSAGKLEQKAETYDTLLLKHKEVLEKIKSVKEAISLSKGETKKTREKNSAEDEEDALDAFMSTLNKKAPLDKIDIRKQKVCLTELEEEEAHLQKLISIARPAALPEALLTKGSSEEPPPVAAEEPKEKEKTPEPEVDNSADAVPEIVRESPVVERKEVIARPAEKSSSAEGRIVRPAVRGPAKPKGISAESLELMRDDGKKGEVEEEDDVSMWLPPDNQTGDGKTKLNEKYGY